MDGIKYTISNRIKEARQKRKISRDKLIDEINKDPERPLDKNGVCITLGFETYRRWEDGTNRVNYEWFPVLCKHLSCDAGYLFGVYDDLKLELANITSSTGFSTEAANVIDGLDTVVGNSRFVEVEKGTLSKRHILSQIIEDDRIVQVLIAAKQAKLLKYNMRQNVNPDVTSEDFSQALFTLNEMNMVALQSDDSVNFYIQEAGRIFMDILRTMIDRVSDNESYSTDLISLDSKTTINKLSSDVWLIDEKTIAKQTP